MWHAGSWRKSQIMIPLGGHLGLYPPVKCMVGVLSSFWRLPVWSPTGATMLDLKVKQFPGKKVGWVVTILVFTKNTGSGWFSIAQNGCENSFKSSKTTTSSIQYFVFFSMFNLQKCWNNSSAIWKKKTSAKGPLSALKKSMGTWRVTILRLPNSRWYNTPGLQKMAKGEQKLH